MIAYITEALIYVLSDQYFLLSMGFTSAIGIFIGALLYDGVLPEVKKAIVVILSYACLVSMTNASRIVPIVVSGKVHNAQQPFASSVTLAFVTIFYVFGMLLGVLVTNKAHGGKHDCRRKSDKFLTIK